MFISCEEAKKLVNENNAQLVDVRTADEFAGSPISGSVNIPLHDIQVSGAGLDKNRPVIVYCVSGQRSHMAQQILMGMGFSQVHNLGSFLAWSQC